MVESPPLAAAPSLPKGALTTSKAKAKVGKVKIVCGEVVSAHYAEGSKGSPTFLNLDRKEGRFTIVIWEEYRGLFDAPPEELFADEWVCVQGKITSYKGVPQIVSLGGDIADPARFYPLTGAAAECLAKGAAMSIACTVLVDEQRYENEFAQDVVDDYQDSLDDYYSDAIDDYYSDAIDDYGSFDDMAP